MIIYFYLFFYSLKGIVSTHSGSIPTPDDISCTESVHPAKPFPSSAIPFHDAGQATQAHRARNKRRAFSKLHPSITGWTGPVISTFVPVTVQLATAAQPFAAGGEPALQWKTGNHSNLCWYSGQRCSGERSEHWHADQHRQRASMDLSSFNLSCLFSLAFALFLHQMAILLLFFPPWIKKTVHEKEWIKKVFAPWYEL